MAELETQLAGIQTKETVIVTLESLQAVLETQIQAQKRRAKEHWHERIMTSWGV